MVKRIAVVLVAHGEAESTGFIENYRVSLHTLERASTVIPVPVPLRHVISFSSSLKKRFAGTGNGSPQNPLTRIQAERLQEHLDRHIASMTAEVSYEVMAAFSTSEPTLEPVLEMTRKHDARIVVPMAPVDNAMSCGLLCDHLARVATPDELARTRVVGRLWNDPSLHTAMLNHLFTECRHEPAVSKEARVLMLLFHGTLVEERNGKVPSFRTGHLESLLFARRLTSLIESDARNRWGRVVTAFLNHDVGGKWSSPSFEEACHQFVGATCRQLSLFAAGYFSDGNETVHRSSHPALSRPELEVEAIPCLNDSSSFIACLAGKVVAATRQILVFSGDSFETVV